MHYRGAMTAADLAPIVCHLEEQMKLLGPGFKVLADFSGLDSMDLDCGPFVAHIMDLCRTRGAGTIVRVAPDPQKDIGINILSIIHYKGKVPIVTCTTLAEAEEKLA